VQSRFWLFFSVCLEKKANVFFKSTLHAPTQTQIDGNKIHFWRNARRRSMTGTSVAPPPNPHLRCKRADFIKQRDFCSQLCSGQTVTRSQRVKNSLQVQASLFLFKRDRRTKAILTQTRSSVVELVESCNSLRQK
jgi:hypothetical protein